MSTALRHRRVLPRLGSVTGPGSLDISHVEGPLRIAKYIIAAVVDSGSSKMASSRPVCSAITNGSHICRGYKTIHWRFSKMSLLWKKMSEAPVRPQESSIPNVIAGAQENLSCWLPGKRISSERQTLACNSHLCIVDGGADTIRQLIQRGSRVVSQGVDFADEGCEITLLFFNERISEHTV